MEARHIHIGELKTYRPTELLEKRDLGVGVITIYKLADGESYIVMGEYNNKGALTPTVGLRYDEKFGDVYAALKIAHARKRLGWLECDGSIDDKVFYATTAQLGCEQKSLARLTFINRVNCNLSLEAFKKEVIEPMHAEASLLGKVASFFWQLDETVKGNQWGFKSNQQRGQAAQAALHAAESLQSHRFQPEIIDKLRELIDDKVEWCEKDRPLMFFAQNNGANYSQLTSFCIMPVSELKQHISNAEIITIHDKKQSLRIPSPFIVDASNARKKYCLFEDEVKTILDVINHISPDGKIANAEKQGLGFFKPCEENKLQTLESPWQVTSASLDRLKENLNEEATFDSNELAGLKSKGSTKLLN